MKIDQVSDSVHVVAGTNVNWALISDERGVTLVDAGYPSDTESVLKSVREIGRALADIAAVVVTHAHLDHIGAIPTLVDKLGVPVYTGAEEVRHAKREYLEQITPVEMVQQLGTRRGIVWVSQTVRAVIGHIKMSVPTAEPLDADTLAALPGGLVAIPTPGHTDGHTAYFMPSEGVLFSGDTLVTGHPLLPGTGLQLLPSVFNHDEAGTLASAHVLAKLEAEVLVPGHGLPVRRDVTSLLREFDLA
ncbi:MBL fold metallo-hydrolase [Nocardia seriolae]|uniref:MBL fold metallo-hydrolase n=1 Tax=Nocardia seriolae TaxID=37332 RepID=A0A0B8N0M1_9NOCA|nr:MBL fold metallo-hydrolase [Nocardia seriolae]MTJ62018.1 MBL fold metallo-hydrolase [Nocardia seriolae]MTJ71105.1 MBL fold metallo-hydrolase [Nocardia seriolae]MTJ89956.1 MBL fold metallo-hydrolase [Nocardia seriolae]MTK33930.1 MBL fold metallo-hydrolase [Nocardia seriolae]MTK39969.1 MBL fold metallo-hydrolase [Nocardia seriolae]